MQSYNDAAWHDPVTQVYHPDHPGGGFVSGLSDHFYDDGLEQGGLMHEFEVRALAHSSLTRAVLTGCGSRDHRR